MRVYVKWSDASDPALRLNGEFTNPWENPAAALIYDQIHRDTDDISVLLELARATGGPVLEVGCGTGRCLVPFIRSGYDTVGLDRSQAMLDILRRKLKKEPDDVVHRATPLAGDGRDFSIPLRFALAFIGKDSFCHFLQRSEQESFVGNVFTHLRPGGMLMVDIFNPNGGRVDSNWEESWEATAGVVTERVTLVDFANQTLGMHTTVRKRDREVVDVRWTMRWSYRFELELLLEKAGFEIVSEFGNYVKSPYEDGCPRLIVIARKPPDADMTVVKLMHAAVPEVVR